MPNAKEIRTKIVNVNSEIDRRCQTKIKFRSLAFRLGVDDIFNLVTSISVSKVVRSPNISPKRQCNRATILLMISNSQQIF